MLTPYFQRPSRRSNPSLFRLFSGRPRNPFALMETHVVASRLDRQSARAIECLAHAIEYLEDTKPLTAETTPRTKAVEDAVTMLKARNRDIFFSCSTQAGKRAAAVWTGTLGTGYDHHTEWTNC